MKHPEPTKEQWRKYNLWRESARNINLTVYKWIEKFDPPKKEKKI